MEYKLYGEIDPNRKTGKYLGWSVEADTPEDALKAAKIHIIQVRRSNARYTDYGKRLDRGSYLQDEDGRTFDINLRPRRKRPSCAPGPCWDFSPVYESMGDAIGRVE